MFERLKRFLGQGPQVKASARVESIFDGLSEYEQGLALVLAIYAWRFVGVNIRDSLTFGFKSVILIRPDHPHGALREDAREAVAASQRAFAESNTAFQIARDEFVGWIMSQREPDPPDGFERFCRALGPTGYELFWGEYIRARAKREPLQNAIVRPVRECWNRLSAAFEHSRLHELELPPFVAGAHAVLRPTRACLWMIVLTSGCVDARSRVLREIGWTLSA